MIAKSYIISSKHKSIKNYEYLVSKFQLIEGIKAYISDLSPAELMSIFPVEKTYDGDRTGRKDYFYTMQEIQKLGIDKPIGDNVTELLYDYQNWDIKLLMVESFGVISDIRQANGEKGLMEEFCEKNDIAMYTTHVDSEGRKFIRNSETGKITRMWKRMPRYLRLVKVS